MVQIPLSVIKRETPLTTEWWNFMILQGLTTITGDNLKDHMLTIEEIDYALNFLPLNWKSVSKTELTNWEKELVRRAYFTLKYGFDRIEKELRNNSTQVVREFLSSKINFALHKEAMLSLKAICSTLKRLKALEKDMWDIENNDLLLKLLCDIFGMAPIVKQLNQYVEKFTSYDYSSLENVKIGHSIDIKLISLSNINFKCLIRNFGIEVV